MAHEYDYEFDTGDQLKEKEASGWRDGVQSMLKKLREDLNEKFGKYHLQEGGIDTEEAFLMESWNMSIRLWIRDYQEGFSTKVFVEGGFVCDFRLCPQAVEYFVRELEVKP